MLVTDGMVLPLIVSFRVLALPMGPAPHFPVVGNGTPEEIQEVVDTLCRSI
jgi:hypothetical protein